jgi:hypothetical protein
VEWLQWPHARLAMRHFDKTWGKPVRPMILKRLIPVAITHTFTTRDFAIFIIVIIIIITSINYFIIIHRHVDMVPLKL